MAIAWTPDMATGAQSLDDEHRRIIARANALVSVLAEHADAETVGRAMRGLGDAALRHFTRDEDCAVRDRCPALETNGEAHARFLGILARFRADYERRGACAEVAGALERDLVSWIGESLPGPYGDRLPCIALG